MNPSEILRIVDAIHRDKNIDKEIVFEGIEAALVSALKKVYGEEAETYVTINRQDGSVSATCEGEVLDSEEVVGRIGAQTAKQVMIQKIREAERDALYDEYDELVGQMVSGIIQRYEGAAATVTLGNVEALLPRSEQIPGETHHAGERVRATVYEARKAGSRVKVILSRRSPALVQRLFEQEIPEIADGVIEIRAMAREPGYRSKVAVSSSDARVDCVGACVGVRGNRIKNIVDELSGERIDIVRWDDDLEVLIPNALQPAEVDQVILCRILGKAVVLVREDNLSLAIGRRGQNVRLASKLSGWDIEIMTQEELAQSIDQAVEGFSMIEGITQELAERLVEEGFLNYEELSIIEPEDLMQMGSLTEEQAQHIVDQAETRAEEAEAQANAARRLKKEKERVAELQAQADAERAAIEGPPPEAAPEEASEEAAAEGAEGETSEATEEAAEGADSEAAEAAGSEAVEQSPAEADEPDQQEVAEDPSEPEKTVDSPAPAEASAPPAGGAPA
ncbi:hypothetical protein Pla175_08980 [Pirellulimonas nuda]|uniref:Transcription termination/antitermination protein NusA n=1 Tax=Pirellulimonas nuda TaxID=2528009 RepID=A0A518D7U8_9BACT|nr:transcription termination factor NusA [Pirellulimonas nuda]QDU87536.1 hypothetical protein Pla175_08980 [Pirellulimonas nuda]